MGIRWWAQTNKPLSVFWVLSSVFSLTDSDNHNRMAKDCFSVPCVLRFMLEASRITIHSLLPRLMHAVKPNHVEIRSRLYL